MKWHTTIVYIKILLDYNFLLHVSYIQRCLFILSTSELPYHNFQVDGERYSLYNLLSFSLLFLYMYLILSEISHIIVNERAKGEKHKETLNSKWMNGGLKISAVKNQCVLNGFCRKCSKAMVFP